MPQAIPFALAAEQFVQDVALPAVGAYLVSPAGLELAASIGLSLISGALNRQSSNTAAPSDGQQQLKQALAPRRKSYGTVRVSGSVWWYGTPDSAPHNMYVGLAINQGRIGGYRNYLVDSNQVTLDPSTFEITSQPYASGDSWLYSRTGNTPETAYDFSAFNVSNIRGDGIATMVGVFQSQGGSDSQFNIFPNGIPTIRATIQGSVCFDPRQVGQSAADATTWTFSANAAVCLLNYLIDPDGFGLDYDTHIVPNLAAWTAAMNVCDEDVPLAYGGTEKRYIVSGTYAFTDAPKDVVQRFLDCCDGRIWAQRDGSIGIAVGRYAEPTVTITADQVVGYAGFSNGQDPVTAIGGIRAQFVFPDQDFREHEAEPWPDADTVLELDDARVGTLDLSWVPQGGQARRLMKRAYLRATAPWRGTVTVNLAGLRAIDERYVRLQLDELGIDDSFEVARWTFDPGQMTVEMELVAVDSSIDAWTPLTEESPAGPSAIAFGYSASFSKTGPSFNPLTEAGALIGQTVLVFVAASQSVDPLTPTGWTSIMSGHGILSGGPTLTGMGMGAFWRTIDGTETAATFLAPASGSGLILAALFNGLAFPTFSDGNLEITGNNPADNEKELVAVPFMSVMFAVGGVVPVDMSGVVLGSDSAGTTDLAQRTIVTADSVLSGVVKLAIWKPDDVPANSWAVMPDVGNNGILSFVMQPSAASAT